MAEPLVVVGAGGFGRETLDVVDALAAAGSAGAAGEPSWEVLGVLDDAPTATNLRLLAGRGTPYLGATTDQDVLDRLRPGTRYVVGVGNPRVRRVLADRLASRGLEPATLVHPSATTGHDVELGPGTVVCAGVRITTHVRTGRHVHLNPNVTVGHDTTLGDFVSVNPAASVSGDCVVEDEVLIGVGAVVLNQLTVGRGATVGGAACVVRDVPPGVVVKGVPAR